MTAPTGCFTRNAGMSFEIQDMPPAPLAASKWPKDGQLAVGPRRILVIQPQRGAKGTANMLANVTGGTPVLLFATPK